MGEIVVAYAQPDEDAAELVMEKLKALGFSVKGTEIAPPPLARTSSRRAPAYAGPQVVLWSKHYAAAYAKGAAFARSPIIAARLDTAPVSGRLKTDAVDLRAWRGRDDHRGWRALVADVRTVAALASGNAAAELAPAKATPAKAEKKSGGAAIAVLTLVALAAAGGGAAYYLGLIP